MAAVAIAAIAILIRPVPILALGRAIFPGIVPLSSFLISVVSAIPISVGSISGAAIVVMILRFVRGKAIRHARGEQRRR